MVVGDSGVYVVSLVYIVLSLGLGGGSEFIVEQMFVYNVDLSFLLLSEYDEVFILYDFDSFVDMCKQEMQLELDFMMLVDVVVVDILVVVEMNDLWVQMFLEEIVKEIIKVVIGGKGEGERIILYLYVYFVFIFKFYLMRKKSVNVYEFDC